MQGKLAFAALLDQPGLPQPAWADSQVSRSISAVSSSPASLVLTMLPGSNHTTAVSGSARGQCSTPRGTTKSSPRPQHEIAISHLDGELSAKYQEELVGGRRAGAR
jgi:hypothetical protein